ncbi:polysaccharide biosynthesis C-terminal domain-containing protein [Stackebrandtia soli]
MASLLGFAEAAVYTVATRFVTLGQLATGAIGTAAQPRLATCMGRGDYATARALYQTTTAWIVLATWPLFLTTAVAAPFYLGLFGPEYTGDDAVAVVWVLAAGMVLSSGCGVVDMVLSMAGRTSWQLYNVCAALAVNVTIDLLLIPRWGILGAAIGWTAALAVNNLIPLCQLAFTFGLHPFGRSTTRAMALAAACFVVPPLAGESFGSTALVVSVMAAVGCYLATAWRFRATLIRPATT